MSLQQVGTLALLMWNLVVFLVYGVDKGKARKQLYRISEKTLLGMALCLGGFGAALAGSFFHHKTRKWYFQVIWCLGSVGEILFLYWLWHG